MSYDPNTGLPQDQFDYSDGDLDVLHEEIPSENNESLLSKIKHSIYSKMGKNKYEKNAMLRAAKKQVKQPQQTKEQIITVPEINLNNTELFEDTLPQRPAGTTQQDQPQPQIIYVQSPQPQIQPAVKPTLKHKLFVVIFNALALLIFCAGVYILYISLPTHIELVVGLVFIAVSSNILTNGLR